MSDSLSRRDFLKRSSVVGLAAAVNPVSSIAAEPRPLSRVVIATDPECSYINEKKVFIFNKDKVPAMVDNAIMTLTGKTSKGAAYEAIFPAPVTNATKILLKRNDISGKGAVNAVVVEALKTGLTSMLGGTFPAANITIRCQGGSAKTQTSAATYIINCPVCWCHGGDYGVTLSLKNTMTYLNSAGTYHSANKAWLHNVSLDPAIKSKQVLSFMDATVGNHKDGPGTSALFAAGVIIVSKDLVAVDYNALRLLAKQTGAVASRIATGDNQLKAAQAAGLGTCVPSEMEVINIKPPFTTGIAVNPETGSQPFAVEVLNKGNSVEFVVPGDAAEAASVSIFDMRGRNIRQLSNMSANRISWDYMAQDGSRVGTGIYAFAVKIGNSKVRGYVRVAR